MSQKQLLQIIANLHNFTCRNIRRTGVRDELDITMLQDGEMLRKELERIQLQEQLELAALNRATQAMKDDLYFLQNHLRFEPDDQAAQEAVKRLKEQLQDNNVHAAGSQPGNKEQLDAKIGMDGD